MAAPMQWLKMSGSGQGPRILTKADMAYWQLREEILEGRLAPGTLLDQEALADRLGLSTTPVREALRRLEAERLVVGRAHRDTVVAELSTQLLVDTYTVRISLDPLAVSMAAKAASDEDLAKIRAIAEEHVADDPLSELHRNRELHRAIYMACGNPVLIELLESLWDRTDRYRYITIDKGEELQRPHDEHMAIVEALCARDGKKAAAIMSTHIKESLKRIRKSEQLTG